MWVSPRARGPSARRGEPVFATHIKCARRGGPAHVVRALSGPGLNGPGRPSLSSLLYTPQVTTKGLYGSRVLGLYKSINFFFHFEKIKPTFHKINPK